VEQVVLAIGVPMYIAVHREYAVTFFGEDDAANFVSDAIFWRFSGSPTPDLVDYRLRTSPLYVHALERAMRFGVPVGALPWAMTLSSIIASTAVLVIVYFLFRSLVGRGASAMATALLTLTPGMWLGATYGMAHIPGLAFMMASLLLVAFVLDDDPRTPVFWGRFIGALACAFVGLSFKADFILMGFAFPGLAFVKRRGWLRTLVLAPAPPLIGLGMQIGYARMLVNWAKFRSPWGHALDSTISYAAYWHDRFPFSLDAVLLHRTTDATLGCAGPFLTAVALFALACLFFMREHTRYAVWLSWWALPPMLFWAFIDGNSARHNIAAMPPLMLAVSILLMQIAETPLRAVALAASVATLNYVSDMNGGVPGLGTMEPRTNLLGLSEYVTERSNFIWRYASPFAGIQSPKKVAIERHWLAWTTFAEIANAERRGKVSVVMGRTFRLEQRGAPPREVQFVYCDDPWRARKLAQVFRDQGFFVWSAEFPL
jgi:hypothetical protein